MALAIARLEVAVERLLTGPSGAGRVRAATGEEADVPALRAEIAALAARLDASIARLREVVRDESEPGTQGTQHQGTQHRPDRDEED